MNNCFDIVIIGGGINGAGIARDAAGRGLSVCLFEKGDFGSSTSSKSTKLIHGGLRYLEHYKFRLVRESLIEREVLWCIAPHIIWPLRFILPYHKSLRPAWLLRLGLFIYDNLGGRRFLPPTRTINFQKDVSGKSLETEIFQYGFEYSDCWVDDARLVILNLKDAKGLGAKIYSNTEVVSFAREKEYWKIRVRNKETSTERKVLARVVVNAAGPWVDDILRQVIGIKNRTGVRLVQGSHIVVPQIFSHEKAYIFQNKDGRIIFAIPYEEKFTMIGTNDKDYNGSLDKVTASVDEINYLCDAVNQYFSKKITCKDVVWSFSGVRALYNDGANKAQEATRDYVIDFDTQYGAPILSVFGGKITTYRRLAEEVLKKLSYIFDIGTNWTSRSKLPGGNFSFNSVDEVYKRLIEDYPFLDQNHAKRLIRSYGTLSWNILGKARNYEELGILFGANLTESEVRYLVNEEWAKTEEDILWRRTKLGLLFKSHEVDRLARYLDKEVLIKKTS